MKKTLLALLVVGSFPLNAPAQVIIHDTFQANTSPFDWQTLPLDGQNPSPVDVPFSTWNMASGDGDYEAYLTSPSATPSSSAVFHHTASAGLSITSVGSYVKPSLFTVSATMSFYQEQVVPWSGYDLLGFYSALDGTGTYDPLHNFTGLALDPTGTLFLAINDHLQGTGISFGGTFDPLSAYTLSYQIDTTTGSISNISLSGSSSTYSFASTDFTDDATQFLGIGGNHDSNKISSIYTNLEMDGVTIAVPEPSAVILMCGGFLGLALLQARRRKALL
jgi:hypothetical protein